MATISMHRTPFAEVGAARLQALSSIKNRQNAITDKLAASSKDKQSEAFASPNKRPFTPSIFEDEEIDSENVDPTLFTSKRSKGTDGVPQNKGQPLFSLSTDINFATTAKPPSAFSHQLQSNTFTSFTSKRNAAPKPVELPLGTSSAPAGRSPKHKRVGILSKKRTSLSPFKRIDPPSFGLKGHSSTSIPFSIDAALSGTVSGFGPRAPAARPKAPTLEESMPKGWFFKIHEDTPEEEAANMMEHSTYTLDISSDDEEGSSLKKDDRGKENIPPHEIGMPVPESTEDKAARTSKYKARRSVHVDAMVDVGDERAPLGLLPAEEFYAAGLDASSVEVVPGDEEPKATGEETAAGTTEEVLSEAVAEESPVNNENIELPVVASPVDEQSEAPAFVIAEDPAPLA